MAYIVLGWFVLYLLIGLLFAWYSIYAWRKFARAEGYLIGRFLLFPWFTLSGRSINREPAVGRLLWWLEHDVLPDYYGCVMVGYYTAIMLLWPLKLAWMLACACCVFGGYLVILALLLIILLFLLIFTELPHIIGNWFRVDKKKIV